MISATPEMCFEFVKCMLTATEMHPKQARSQGQRIFYAHACTPRPIPNTLCIANFDQLGSPQKDTCKRLWKQLANHKTHTHAPDVFTYRYQETGILKKSHLLFWGILPWKLTCPLKISGWKMYSLVKYSSPFLGDMLVFGGVVLMIVDDDLDDD